MSNVDVSRKVAEIENLYDLPSAALRKYFQKKTTFHSPGEFSHLYYQKTGVFRA